MAGCNEFQHQQLASNANIKKNISSSSSEARPFDVQGGGGGGGDGRPITKWSSTTTTRTKKLSNSNKRNKLLDLKVVYISTPMKVKTCASKFREIVQQLTGKYSDVARIMEEITSTAGKGSSSSAQDDTYHYWTTEADDVNKLYNHLHQDQKDQDQYQYQNVRQITTERRKKSDSPTSTSSSCSLSTGGTTSTTEGSTTSSLILNNNIADENLLDRGQFDHHPFMMDGPDHHPRHQYHSFMAAAEQPDHDDADDDDADAEALLLQGPFNFLEFLCDQNGPDPEQDHLVDVLPSF